MRRLPLLAALALAPAAAPAQQADTHAIVGARVVTVSGPVHERATIVMRDGLITAVGPDVTPPAGARVIDGKGLVVTPGLIDGLSSIGIPGATRSGSGSGGSGSGAPAATPTPPGRRVNGCGSRGSRGGHCAENIPLAASTDKPRCGRVREAPCSRS